MLTHTNAAAIPYTPHDWTAGQHALHNAATLEEAFHHAACLCGGWYRRPVTIDVLVTSRNDERYMIRPSEAEPLPGWSPCYTVGRA